MHAILWASSFRQKLSEMDFLQSRTFLLLDLHVKQKGQTKFTDVVGSISKWKFASQASIFCIYFSSLVFHAPTEKPTYSDHAMVFTAQTSKPVLLILVSWSLRTVSVTFKHRAHKSLLLLTDMHRVHTTVTRGNGIQQGMQAFQTHIFIRDS